MKFDWFRFYRANTWLFYFLSFAFLISSTVATVIPDRFKYLGLLPIFANHSFDDLLLYYLLFFPFAFFIFLAFFMKNKYIKLIWIFLAIIYNLGIGRLFETLASV